MASALQDAEHYALSDYLVALASGAEQGAEAASDEGGASSPGFRSISCAGISRASPPSVFIKEFDRAKGQVLSRYDGSVERTRP